MTEKKEGATPKAKKKAPTLAQLKKELKHERYRRSYGVTLRSTIFSLVCVAAVAVLVATLLMPVLQIYGDSMNPSLEDGDIVACVKTGSLETGDLVSFYYNNKILVKRVIAGAGDWVEIAEDGTVSVNGIVLDEPYLTEKALGSCNIEMPYQVPDGRWFVMGDNRAVSVDSRDKSLGCISEEQILGRLVFRIWPTNRLSRID